MSQTDNSVSFALSFPQGHILFMQRGGTYFVPAHAMDGFQIYGESKELFGKKAITVNTSRTTGAQDYSVVYEFNDAQHLTDARLVTRGHTLHGTLASQDTVDSFNGALAQGALTLYTTRDTQSDSIFNVARLTDGRYLIQMSNTKTLYLGTPGNYRRLDAHLYLQGGNSMYYKDSDGGDIRLPWSYGGPRGGELPTFKGEEMNYVMPKQNGDPAEFGLTLPPKPAHLSPFHPQVFAVAKGKDSAAPKP